MSKVLSNTLIFLLGFAMAMTTFGATRTNPISPSGSSAVTSKQIVLANLESKTPNQLVHNNAVADAVARVEPAVVDVHTRSKALVVPSSNSGDPLLQQFLGGPAGGPPQEVVAEGAGSGIIISRDGYIITNNHVTQNAESVTVTVADKGYNARVIGSDSVSDIAVVKIDPPNGVQFPVALLGNSDDLRVGDWAIAVGNPLDIGTTVTLGIVSALNRRNLSADGQPLGALIQTDAAINPGNSGGALANIYGQIIGVNEAIYSPTGTFVGIGFAIPINSVKKIAIDLIRNGKVVRPYLGVSYAALQDIPEPARRQLGLPLSSNGGVIVDQVFPGSPAADAGLKKYDVILEANHQSLTDENTLNDIISRAKVGDTLVLLVMRDGHNMSKKVALQERPSSLSQGIKQ